MGKATGKKLLQSLYSPQIQGAIFDLDGTLLESMGVWEQIDRDFLAARGCTIPSGYMEKITAMRFSDAAAYTIMLFDLPDSVESLLRLWNDMAIDEYSHRIFLKPYAKSYLLALKEAGVQLAVATSLPAVLYEPALKNNGIFHLFDAFCTISEVAHGKESPDIFLLAAQKLSLAPHACMVFEDILPAIEAAKQAKMTVYGVYDRYSAKDAPAIQAVADGYLRDWSQAPPPLSCTADHAVNQNI